MRKTAQADAKGRWDAAVVNSGPAVDDSVPGVIQPTPPARAGRKPDTCPSRLSGAADHAKSRPDREAEGLAFREADALRLDQQALSHLRGFFELLDCWDREAARDDEIM